MNLLHGWYCRSGSWKRKLETEILPWSLTGVEFGNDVLEVGPGPGLTTDWLRRRCKALTCLEVDPRSAHSLSQRLANTNVQVQCGDATAMPYDDRAFSCVVSFTMLHHVPSAALQDRLFAEVLRVLQPGGIFVGVDSLDSVLMKIFHVGDTMVLVPPPTLAHRLEQVGFKYIEVQANAERFRFSARRRL